MIHKYKLFQNNIVIDVNSGNIHVVSDVLFDILNYIDKDDLSNTNENIFKKIDFLENVHKKEDIILAISELKNLYENKRIFTPDYVYEYYKTGHSTENPLKSMCLSVAHDCNFKCAYCFAQNGSYGLPEKSMMNEQIAFAAIDFLIKNSNNTKILEVDFFGGEPLLNYNVVKKTVEYARKLEKIYKKLFRFTITTNAFGLSKDKIEFFNKEMHNVVLSLDGRKSTNDRFRKTIRGNSTYDIVAKNIKDFIQSRKHKKYCIRGTFTSHNLNFSKDVIDLYEKLNAKNISLEPVICEENLEYAIKPYDLPKIFSEYENLAKLLINSEDYKDLNYVRFSINLNQRPCPAKILKACSCGNEYIAIAPNGNIYPCHQFIGRENWILGNVKNGFSNLNLRKIFTKATIFNKKKCKNCWAKFYCAGGCNANNHQFNNDICEPHKISCEIEKKRIECAIALQVTKALS